MYQPVKKVFTAGLVLFAIFILLLWSGRNSLVRQYISHRLERIEKQHKLSIRYTAISMEGLSGIRIDGLTVVPAGTDTLLKAHSLQVKLALPELLLLKPQIQSLGADQLQISFIKKDSISNFDFLYRTKPSFQSPPQVVNEERDYAHRAKKTLDMLFKLLPDNASIQHLSVSYSNKGDELLIQIPSFIITDNQFTTAIRSTENGLSSEWICEGVLQDRERKIEARLHARENTKITLPFLEYRWGALIQFDTLAFTMEETAGEEGIRSLRGQTHVSGLTVYQERISPDTVLLNQGTFDWHLNVGRNYLELDSTTKVSFNKLTFHPYLKVTKEKDWRITASVDKLDFPANDLFSSLPQGLFYNLEGLETSGTLSYHFLLDVDLGQIDSLLFESSLTARNFRILNFGQTDLRKMNEPFLYTAYEHGEPVRTFELGEGNPSYRPYSAISPYLPLSIMQCEDAGFFYHNGFIPSAIRESLVQDLKERRFARGGSTISMQLVKNVFLSRNKTIARKLEEMLIVWLIESNRLTPKERMFEVYLNIVEWGPLIYGASEASHYYFGKEPSALTLSECIFLASIIPKPKYVRNCFDGLTLKPYYTDFYQLIVNRLIDRGLITPEEAAGAGPDIIISGPAKTYLQRDTISSFFENPSELLSPFPAPNEY